MSGVARYRFALLGLLGSCAVSLLGCGIVLPTLEPIGGSQPDPKNPHSISINEVVKRVKCEIWDSIKDRPEKSYPWFNKWVVQADLTLTVNDSSSINPGATFINPLTTESIPLRITNMARSASLGLGGGLTNTAYRTEIVSFSISIPELRKEFETPKTIIAYNDCNPYGFSDLTGNLGLAEWVNSSLGPVDNGLLTEGQHPAPKAPSGTQGLAPSIGGAARLLAKGQTPLPTPPTEFPITLQDSIMTIYNEYYVLLEVLKLLGAAQTDLNHHTTNADYPTLRDELDHYIKLLNDSKEPPSSALLRSLATYSSKIDGDVKPKPDMKVSDVKAIAADSLPIISVLAAQISSDLTPVIPLVQLQCDCYPSLKDYNTSGAEVLKCLNTIQNTVKLLNPAKPQLNPPLDAISHQVNFVVAWSASANPLWTLVHFKGPSPSSGNFASLSESNTHNLTLVMGTPGSAATQNSRSSLTLSSALATQLAPQLGFAPSIVP